MIWGRGVPPAPSLPGFVAEDFAVVLAEQTISIGKNRKEA